MITEAEELRIYNLHENTIEDQRYVDYFKRFIHSAILDYCKTGGNGLDFGSGPSPVLATLLERDYDYSMDIYDRFYAPDKIYEGQKYNLITATEVVEHLKNPLDYFHQFKALLDEDGLLSIMTTFHPRNDAAFMNWHYMREACHISFYTLKTMTVISEMVGLKIIYSDGQRYTSFKLL
ncbi:hypothetical protein AKG39_11165 [Acetobacterium bakii]|uniref:2-polyprenyl-3-methyl-5-hydroxy-6-metoxy-1, 4-benzoquinol methylase n=1 Tax=Acetobacterium bakii TaxID=52689 RepID=A0A0L6TZC9_9FIRM|nr:hypothetical protein AKG39_11165 [Acetobacterium bakii]